MKRKLLTLCFSGLLFTTFIYSQSNSNVPSFTVQSPDMATLSTDDEARAKQGIMYRIGVNMPVDIDIYKDGTWYSDNEGNLVYQVHLQAAGAKAINVSFDEYTLPENAELRLFSQTTNYLVGPYTSDNNIEEGHMSTAMVKGDNAILEVMIPANAKGEFKLHIQNVGYFYRNVDPFASEIEDRDFGDSDPSCEVNVNCSEGSSWQNQKAGVVKILLEEGGQWGYCSGSLVNNTSNDCTPYVLTAQHCGSSGTAAEFRNWVFYFNYEASGCSNPGSEPTLKSITGSVRVASSGTISDVQKSDFLLVILKSRPAATLNSYYNGWNRNATASSSGVGIHHPAGDIKKISTYTSTLVSTSWDGSTPNSHWRVTWAATTNGHGVTEGGSSGSPIFNGATGLIVGNLSGGGSFCSSPNSPDLYGKFAYSWNSCGSTNQTQLAPWLDRANTSPMTLTGMANSCTAASTPVVDFNASNVYPLVNTEVVTLTDASTNSPFYWQWYITPATYTFTGGTNAYSQNPQVTFSAIGTYTVVLYAANTAGYNFKTKGAYIHVGNMGIDQEEANKIVMYPNPASDMLYINLGNNTWDVEKTTISIMDLAGKYVMVQRVSSSNANTVSVSIPADIANGFYMVQVTDGKNTKTEKLEIVK